MGTLMNALSILDNVRRRTICGGILPCKVWLRNFKSIWEKGTEQSRFPCITFCEGMVPDVESPFLGLENVEISNNQSHQGLQGSNVASEEKYGVVFHADPSMPGQVQNGR